jgi:hypothetical protein
LTYLNGVGFKGVYIPVATFGWIGSDFRNLFLDCSVFLYDGYLVVELVPNYNNTELISTIVKMV